jgi:hemerythrin-like domain-containing protein
MDALTFLRQDHKSVLGMLEVLDGAPGGTGSASSGLSTMVTNLVIAESQHEAIEEQIFWPAVRDALEEGDALADKAIQQEQEGKVLLQRLEDGEPGEPDYQEALQQFVKAGREHIAFEQEVVWPLFEAAVTHEELLKMGEKLEVAKKIAPTRPHPDTPPNPAVLKTMGMATAVVDHVRDAASGRAADNPPDPQVH